MDEIVKNIVGRFYIYLSAWTKVVAFEGSWWWSGESKVGDQITSEVISNTHGVLRRDRGTLVPTSFMKSGDQGPEGL